MSAPRLDYRDVLIADLADAEARALEALHEVIRERDTFRALAVQAIHQLHDQHVARCRFDDRYVRLLGEYRALRAAA